MFIWLSGLLCLVKYFTSWIVLDFCSATCLLCLCRKPVVDPRFPCSSPGVPRETLNPVSGSTWTWHVCNFKCFTGLTSVGHGELLVPILCHYMIPPFSSAIHPAGEMTPNSRTFVFAAILRLHTGLPRRMAGLAETFRRRNHILANLGRVRESRLVFSRRRFFV